MAMLWRYSNEGRWRLAFTSEAEELERQGWLFDGPVGYASLSPAPPPAPEGCHLSGPSSDLRLRAGVASRGRAVRIGYGRAYEIRGRLRDADGRPVAGAEICVASKTAVRRSAPRRRATLTTDARGRLRFRARARASERFWLIHGAEAAATRTSVRVRVPAPVSLRVSRRTVHPPRQKLLLRGRVRARRRLAGALVALEARRPGRWQTFGHARVDRRGRFRFRYSFTRSVGDGRFRFRARVPAQRSSPFAPGTSRVRRVDVVSR